MSCSVIDVSTYSEDRPLSYNDEGDNYDEQVFTFDDDDIRLFNLIPDTKKNFDRSEDPDVPTIKLPFPVICKIRMNMVPELHEIYGELFEVKIDSNTK